MSKANITKYTKIILYLGRLRFPVLVFNSVISFGMSSAWCASVILKKIFRLNRKY